MLSKTTPLLINSKDILLLSGERITSGPVLFKALESCDVAFETWSNIPPTERRALLHKAAENLRSRSEEFSRCMQGEMHAPPEFADFNVKVGIETIEENAALVTDASSGSIPVSGAEVCAPVFKEPLGAVLVIAPWNAPIILGLRGIVAPLAAGNTVLFKGSELSSQTHYLLATVFRDVGFPPGVVDFVLHRPEDAGPIYETMITHRAVRKCNFTASSNVGRIIGSKAARALKPVLLELEGKNFVQVFYDADTEKAAEQVFIGPTLNNGQACMSTELVVTVDAVHDKLVSRIRAHLRELAKPQSYRPREQWETWLFDH
ncbi:hypothetical protein AnigIFM59636_002679 [Aspergillus niger]|nr:hypothetical protein AnigIFM59636_002679 [Aspergillus niger]